MGHDKELLNCPILKVSTTPAGSQKGSSRRDGLHCFKNDQQLLRVIKCLCERPVLASNIKYMRITFATLFSHEPLFVLSLKRTHSLKSWPNFHKIHYLSFHRGLRRGRFFASSEVPLKNYPKQPRKSATP